MVNIPIPNLDGEVDGPPERDEVRLGLVEDGRGQLLVLVHVLLALGTRAGP